LNKIQHSTPVKIDFSTHTVRPKWNEEVCFQDTVYSLQTDLA